MLASWQCAGTRWDLGKLHLWCPAENLKLLHTSVTSGWTVQLFHHQQGEPLQYAGLLHTQRQRVREKETGRQISEWVETQADRRTVGGANKTDWRSRSETSVCTLTLSLCLSDCLSLISLTDWLSVSHQSVRLSVYLSVWLSKWSDCMMDYWLLCLCCWPTLHTHFTSVTTQVRIHHYTVKTTDIITVNTDAMA